MDILPPLFIGCTEKMANIRIFLKAGITCVSVYDREREGEGDRERVCERKR